MAQFLWGPPTLILLMGVGLYLNVNLRFYPLRHLFPTLGSLIRKNDTQIGKNTNEAASKGVSPVGALMTSLAACIGTGNVVGVAVAMSIGGPGTLVWMWLSAIVGMATQFAECALAVKYREKNDAGEYCGGPMYTLKNGLGNKRMGLILGTAFAVCTVAASFGIGNMVQANSISAAVKYSFDIDARISGAIMLAAVAVTIIGGIKTIAAVSGVLVPVMAFMYIVGGIIVIMGNVSNLLTGLKDIFASAFGVKPVLGGAAVSFLTVLRQGVTKGVFSNEAGLGGSAVTAAAAETDSHIKQGCVSMCAAFIDTIIVCSVTGLVIAAAGLYGDRSLSGADLVLRSFETVLGNFGRYIVTLGIILFAYASIPGWEYIGEKALEFLVKKRIYCYIYRIAFCVVVYVGAVMAADKVWELSDIANACMMFPNLVAVLALSGGLRRDIINRADRT